MGSFQSHLTHPPERAKPFRDLIQIDHIALDISISFKGTKLMCLNTKSYGNLNRQLNFTKKGPQVHGQRSWMRHLMKRGVSLEVQSTRKQEIRR